MALGLPTSTRKHGDVVRMTTLQKLERAEGRYLFSTGWTLTRIANNERSLWLDPVTGTHHRSQRVAAYQQRQRDQAAESPYADQRMRGVRLRLRPAGAS
jgi:hypothetical protein